MVNSCSFGKPCKLSVKLPATWYSPNLTLVILRPPLPWQWAAVRTNHRLIRIPPQPQRVSVFLFLLLLMLVQNCLVVPIRAAHGNSPAFASSPPTMNCESPGGSPHLSRRPGRKSLERLRLRERPPRTERSWGGQQIDLVVLLQINALILLNASSLTARLVLL